MGDGKVSANSKGVWFGVFVCLAKDSKFVHPELLVLESYDE
jgi:hypothetical protein